MRNVVIKIEKFGTEIKIYESIEKLHFPREFVEWGIIILAGSNERQMNDPTVQAVFKKSRHNNLSIFLNQLRSVRLTKTNNASQWKNLSQF